MVFVWLSLLISELKEVVTETSTRLDAGAIELAVLASLSATFDELMLGVTVVDCPSMSIVDKFKVLVSISLSDLVAKLEEGVADDGTNGLTVIVSRSTLAEPSFGVTEEDGTSIPTVER